MRILHSLLFTLPLLSFAGCAHSGATDGTAANAPAAPTDKAAAELSPAEREHLADLQEEIAMGREIAAKIIGHFGLVPATAPEAEYVNLVGQTLAKRSGRPELTYRFGVLKSDDVNAYAAPGGYIFVTQGLLAQVKSENELAGALAHELAHVNLRHLYLDIRPKRTVSTEETIARVMSFGRGDMGHSLSKIVGAAMKRLIEDGWGEQKELAADQAGVFYAAASGYDPRGLATLLGRIEPGANAKELTPKRRDALAKVLAGPVTGPVADEKILGDRFQKYLRSRTPASRTRS